LRLICHSFSVAATATPPPADAADDAADDAVAADPAGVLEQPTSKPAIATSANAFRTVPDISLLLAIVAPTLRDRAPARRGPP
jgi:hypothetical protein